MNEYLVPAKMEIEADVWVEAESEQDAIDAVDGGEVTAEDLHNMRASCVRTTGEARPYRFK